MKIDKSILLFSKNDEWCKKVYEYLKQRFKNVAWFKGDWGEKFEWESPLWYASKYDYVISYLFPIVLPKKILDLAKEHAINFHPAPPRYPGIGGYNYAIWNGDKEYGVMVHEMVEQVDSGRIYNVKYFPYPLYGSVKDLKETSMVYMYNLFMETINDIVSDGRIYQSVQDEDTKWYPVPHTRQELQEMCKINVRDTVQAKHIARKVRAFYFPNARDGPFFLINNKKYLVIPIEDEK